MLILLSTALGLGISIQLMHIVNSSLMAMSHCSLQIPADAWWNRGTVTDWSSEVKANAHIGPTYPPLLLSSSSLVSSVDDIVFDLVPPAKTTEDARGGSGNSRHETKDRWHVFTAAHRRPQARMQHPARPIVSSATVRGATDKREHSCAQQPCLAALMRCDVMFTCVPRVAILILGDPVCRAKETGRIPPSHHVLLHPRGVA